MQEIFKDIPWYEGNYQISNLWNLKSLWNKIISRWRMSRKKDKLLKPLVNTAWRIQFNLFKNWISEIKSVHRLVAEAFIPNTNNYPVVMHLDNNPLNNCTDNLKWGMWYHNSQQMANEWRWVYPNSKPVSQYTLNWEFIKKYVSIREARRCTKVHSMYISQCCKWELSSAGGFIWKS